MQVILRTKPLKSTSPILFPNHSATTRFYCSEASRGKAALARRRRPYKFDPSTSVLYASGREQFRTIALPKPGGALKNEVVVDECDFYTPAGLAAINEAAMKLSEEFGVSVAIVNLSHLGVQDDPLRIAMELFDAWFPEEKERAILFLQVENSAEFVIRDTQSGWLATMTGQNILFSDTFVRFFLQPKLRDTIAEYEGSDKSEQISLALAEAIDACHANLKRRRLHDWFEFLPHGLAFYSFFLTPFPYHFFFPILICIIINRRMKNADY